MKRIFPKLKERRVEVPVNRLFTNGMTVYPFIFLTPLAGQTNIVHEQIHFLQQDDWWKWFGPLGWLAWFFLYLLVLPVGWNPWRWKWEHEAFRMAQGYLTPHITRLLRKNYYLWWMGEQD